ncbi:MAG TPA: GxxExxY protein [Tepidisphaeraceae bacterium]|jgi:GxxExxY protein
MNFFYYQEQQAKHSGADPDTEAIAHATIGAAIEVHRVLGSGLSESVYRNALSIELTLRGIQHQCEASVPVFYKEKLVGEGRIDVLVENKLIVELKVVESLNEAHRAQVIAYLAATELTLALLINFNAPILRDGIKRVIRSKQLS